MNTAPNSPFKGYYPNVNPFGISPRYNGNTPLYNLYNKYKTDEVNDSISKVDDTEDANAEIEQGEIVRQELPNGGTLLHKALGKKHNKGGIPVNLPNNSFIFSNFKSTSLNKEELDTYKLGGFSKKVNNMTPSKILEKNVDIKHYNEMEKYLQESKDTVQLKTAQIMKEKYDKVLAKVAALQESKKVNTTMPNFAYLSEDTPQLKEKQIMTQMYQEGGYLKTDDPLSLYMTKEALAEYRKQNPLIPNNNYVAPASNQLTNEEGDKFDWIKPYDWTPNNLSILGNMTQYPRAYNPLLSLEQPVRLREQQINAQQGVNDILANRYMSLKAINQYAPNSIANSQFVDSDVNKQTTDYRNQINQANQSVSTDIHNKNAIDQTRVINSNYDRKAQYSDKMNELYQNMANERNTINATNLNILGKGLQEQNAYNQNIDLLKRQYGWNVQNSIKQQSSQKELEVEIEKINNSNMDESMKKMWLMYLGKKYYQTQSALQNPYS